MCIYQVNYISQNQRHLHTNPWIGNVSSVGFSMAHTVKKKIYHVEDLVNFLSITEEEIDEICLEWKDKRV